MIKTILNFKIRKEILKSNQKFNHKQYMKSLFWGQKLKYFSGYHKKKLIFLVLASVIGYVYDWHRSLYRSLLSLRPDKWGKPDFSLPATVKQQDISKVILEDSTINILTKIFFECDSQLFFGVGRQYMFEVLNDLNLLEKKEDINNFWTASGFYRKRNQVASGVSYQQFLILFEDSLRKKRKVQPNLTEQQFLGIFILKMNEKYPQIQKWQNEFGKTRQKEFLKILPGEQQKKKDIIFDTIKENIYQPVQKIEENIVEKGLKGMTVSDRHVYWQNRLVLYKLKEYGIHRRLKFGAIQPQLKRQLERNLITVEDEVEKIERNCQELEQEYEKLYEETLV